MTTKTGSPHLHWLCELCPGFPSLGTPQLLWNKTAQYHTEGTHFTPKMDLVGTAVFLMDSGAEKKKKKEKEGGWGVEMPRSNLDFRPINLCCCWVAGIQRRRKCVILVCKNLHAYRGAENERHLLVQFHISQTVWSSLFGPGCNILNIWVLK